MATICHRLSQELEDSQKEFDQLKTKHRLDLDNAQKELDLTETKHLQDSNAMFKEMAALKKTQLQELDNAHQEKETELASLKRNFVSSLSAASKETDLVAKQIKANNAVLKRQWDQEHDATLEQSRTVSAWSRTELKVRSSTLFDFVVVSHIFPLPFSLRKANTHSQKQTNKPPKKT